MDDVQVVGALKDYIGFDASKLDKAALRKWLVEGAKILEPAVITPLNLDKYFFDNLESLVEKLIKQESENGPLVVGDAEVTAADVSTYLATFANAPAKSQQILKDNPRLLKKLQRFSREDQEKIVGNPLLLMALQLLIPFLFELFFKRNG